MDFSKENLQQRVNHSVRRILSWLLVGACLLGMAAPVWAGPAAQKRASDPQEEGLSLPPLTADPDGAQRKSAQSKEDPMNTGPQVKPRLQVQPVQPVQSREPVSPRE